ncbi:hypothetical protein BURC_00502 [Burkholderiaceae bacterium]|nr:hypothetical protein BURC_00502 [Burkholderiaceae bacterium]
MLFSFSRARVIRAASVIGCAAGLLAGSFAQAAEPLNPSKPPAKKATAKPSKSSQSAAKPKSLLLSRDELRECMSTKTRLAQQREETVQMQAQLAADKQALQQSGEELKAQLAALDRTNEELVQQHVENHNAREKRVEAFHASAADFNAKVEQLNVQQEAYAKACENKRFDEADELAIRRGK